MREKKNKEIRVAITARGLKQWEVADALGMSDSTLAKKLRYELPEDEKKDLLNFINKMEVE